MPFTTIKRSKAVRHEIDVDMITSPLYRLNYSSSITQEQLTALKLPGTKSTWTGKHPVYVDVEKNFLSFTTQCTNHTAQYLFSRITIQISTHAPTLCLQKSCWTSCLALQHNLAHSSHQILWSSLFPLMRENQVGRFTQTPSLTSTYHLTPAVISNYNLTTLISDRERNLAKFPQKWSKARTLLLV